MQSTLGGMPVFIDCGMQYIEQYFSYPASQPPQDFSFSVFLIILKNLNSTFSKNFVYNSEHL
jgi:hypothetical protein